MKFPSFDELARSFNLNQESPLKCGTAQRITSRRIRYVDFAIQMRMLLAMVILEVSLVVGGVSHLYFQLREVVNQSLFRIHQTGTETMSQLFVREVVIITLGMVAVNLVALVVANWWWNRYVSGIIASFNTLTQRLDHLDLREDEMLQTRHEVLDLMLTWRLKERQRCLELREVISTLEPEADFSTVAVREEYRSRLRKIRRLVPPFARRYLVRGR